MGITKKILPVVLRIAISIVLLGFLLRQVDIKGLCLVIRNADTLFLLLAFIIYFAAYALGIFRWEMLLKGANIHLSLKRVIISFAGGIFFNVFLPSSIGGDFMRSIDLATHTKRPKEVVATVLLDRLSGYIGLVIVALLALLFGFGIIQDRNALVSVSVITAILVVVLLVLFNKFLYTKINQLLRSSAAGKIREAIRNLHEEIHIFRNHKKIILNNLALSIIIQLIIPLAFYIIALSLDIKLNIIYYFVYLPIIGAITLLPISIGGLGLRDAVTVFFFAQAGVNKDLALAMSLINFFFILVFAAIGGLIYILTVRHRRMPHHELH